MVTQVIEKMCERVRHAHAIGTLLKVLQPSEEISDGSAPSGLGFDVNYFQFAVKVENAMSHGPSINRGGET